MDSILRRRARALSTVALAVAICGCAEAARGQDYRIDPLASELHVLVYRAGPLARLGHNHVVAAEGVAGRVVRGPALEGSTVEIVVPVERLRVDAPPLRERYGRAFARMPSEADVAGTTTNMLGQALLDAAAHPQIRVAGVLRRGPDGGYAVDTDIGVKSAVWHGSIPVELEIADDVLIARGSAEITHRALGL
ncbi:MAG TPA: hypothetical protein VLD39_10245, partial [Gammaproteobacteria bacterium]|nr:hypothetical protein [Gammaproteobacteria bacterium]